ncbi:MAG: 16S rRNA (cytidine(1402)-2'-O)-methyltransferase [Patescibacteria group bacterium]
MPTLYVVATPIGNLQDITLRAIDTLKNVSVVLAEDTRMAHKLLSHLGIKKQIIAFHEHSTLSQIAKIVKSISDCDSALITDAGTPSISDPGQRLVSALISRDVAIVPIPGPSALSAILSISDIDCSEFIFLGFPPHKKGRKTLFGRIAESNVPVVLFESPHRIQKTLKELEATCGDHYINVGRELTKIYEEVFRGKLSEAQKHFVGEKQRGEFTIIIDWI